ncbi:MAG: hypothetical protein A2148_04640 [Chloroflexi bacterium RBG_16_68_14]|nr:MAG: hypothetical protein A2148_04640 [Chloroflexi bacterium RBG_16_68_14]
MVAVTNTFSDNGALPVTVAAGDEASGLARIIAQYLEQILGDSPEKRAEAAALRGRLGLLAREGDVAVTIVFEDGGIAIEEGLQEPDAVVSGEVEFLMHLLAGRANLAWEVCGGTVAFRPDLRRPLFGYQAYRLMRLPGVHLWSGLPRPPARAVVVTAVVVGAVLLAWRARSRSTGGAHG